MIRRLTILLLIVGCSTKTTNTITLNADEIKTDCLIECKTFVIASSEWCDCMHQCSSNRLKVVYEGEEIKARITSSSCTKSCTLSATCEIVNSNIKVASTDFVTSKILNFEAKYKIEESIEELIKEIKNTKFLDKSNYGNYFIN